MIDAGDEYRVVAEIPGATKEDLEIGPGPTKGTLSIRARSKEIPRTGQLLVAERTPRPGQTVVRFARIVPVAWDADAGRCRPSLADGVLTVSVPKTRPEAEKK